MKPAKWFAPAFPYLAVWAGLYYFKNAWIALIGFHLAIILVLLTARSKVPIDILFKTRHFTWTRRSIFICAAIGAAIYYFHPYLGIAADLPLQLKSLGLDSSTWPAFIAYFTLANPFIEEYFWRAYLGSDTRGLTFSDLTYAGYHGLVLLGKVHPLMNLISLLTLIFTGWLWRQICRQDEGLLVPVLGHMAGDFTILLSVYLISR
jgi:membrane protease YdiL (CAAX protease family)